VNERKVSASMHRQALAALLFFCGKALCANLPWLQEIRRPRPSRRLGHLLNPQTRHDKFQWLSNASLEPPCYVRRLSSSVEGPLSPDSIVCSGSDLQAGSRESYRSALQ